MLNLVQRLSFAQTPEIDSLLIVAETAKEDTDKVNALNLLSKKSSWPVGNYSKALMYAEYAKQLAENLNFKKGIANSYFNIGDILFHQINYSEALQNHLAALRIFEEIRDKEGTARSYTGIGLVYSSQGDYPRALKNYFTSLKIEEEMGNSSGIAACYNGIGLIYQSQCNYSEALKNHFASLKIYEEMGDKHVIAGSYMNIGVTYYLQKNYSEALKNYLASFKLFEEIGNQWGVAGSYNCIGTIHYIQDNYPEALKNYFASLKIFEEIGNKNGVAICYVNIGELYLSLNDENSARKYLWKGLELCKEIGSKDYIKNCYESFSRLDSAQGDYKSAYDNYKLYIVYRDSLLNEENTKKTTQLEMQYEFDKKEAITQAEQEKKDAISTEQLRRKNQQRNAFLGGFVLMLGLAGVSFRSYRIKKRDNGIITTQKEQVEKKNHEILESINYAKKLQTAVLPPAKVVKEFFSNSFLLYLPRDIVSGDFYWMENKGDTSYFAIADCTGHGVPGAMLSIIGLNGLNRALNEQKLKDPKAILSSLSETVNRHFEKSDATVRDGMDICLCALNNKTKKLTFSGANNPLWIARDNEMLTFKGDRRAIGHDDLKQEFTQQEIQLQDGDTIYLTSDGYQDQLGGKKYLKMMTKVFRTRLLALSTKPMEEQRTTLVSDLDAWKGKHGQTDDVCLMGIRI